MWFSEDAIKGLVTAIGYIPQDGKNGIYFKSYQNHGGYCIFLDFNNQKIIYDSDENPSGIAIKVWERTTSNFSQTENFVVLECVDSLLEKGYAPSCIELEKTYPSGHGRSGRLDVLVKSVDGAPFLMIECKTWGTEFDREQSKMLKDGGQLFTYYANDRDTKFLCLYTSRIDSARERKNVIVDVDPAWASLSGVKEIYDHWNKNFKDNGIFDSYAAPYDVKHRALIYGKLETLKEEHSGKIFNQIMEILRHNAISDKPNAFNKLLNLFVCKIIDEADKNPEDELDFQWLERDTDESLQLRLNDLYKRGMWRFLEIKVIDYEQREVSDKLASIEDSLTKQWIMKMYTDTRLKKSPNFAFVEVQDDRTFALNAKVVREIVELLQAYKFRYEQKHEFLGNFFELLLNTSMKQEAGQFFTPVPITRFIISSLPLAELVQNRVEGRQDEPLPTVIDYACGSGHFLTEYMAQMQKIIDSKIDISHTSPRIRNLIQSWQGFTKFLWAKDSVYGIDLDNRLVKTAKVSAFFNGDGEANIVWANGLDSFTKSEVFRGKLVGASGQDNGKFDILISNPPYSVDAFKSTIKYGEESFELYSALSDNSSEIECLFVERMKQLLKVGGWAAVILPSSILTNSGIHAKAREILLKYFKVKAIVEAGSNTFMKTNTSTVILFLERRSNDDHLNIGRAIERFFTSYIDVAVSDIENAFSTYVLDVYDRLSFEDYISLFKGTPSKAAEAHELYEGYVKTYGDNFRSKAVEVEKEKLLYFLLTYNQNIVLVKTGKGKEEKKFLGYEFSERRGHEGLHHLTSGTKLYDEADPLNPQKASSYIYRAFLGERAEIVESLAKNVSYGHMSRFIEYGTYKFDKKVNLGKRIKINSSYPMVALNVLVQLLNGVTFDKANQVMEETSKVVLTADNITSEGALKIVKKVYLREDFPANDEKRLYKDDIFICLSSGSKEHVGKCAIIKQDIPYFAGGFMGILRKKSDSVLMKYLWAVLASEQYREVLGQGSTGTNINNLGSSLGSIKVPLPSLDIQRKIVKILEQAEREENTIFTQIEVQYRAIEHIFDQIDVSHSELLGKLVKCNPTKADVPNDMLVSFVEMAAVSNDGHIVGAVDRPMIEVRKGGYSYFEENDIIIAKITPCMENGKCAFATGLTNGIGMGSSEFHVFRCGTEILPQYLFGYLNRQVIRQEAEKVMTGSSGHRRVPIGFYKQLLIPLPTLSEQQQIVTFIQEAEDQITQLNARLDTLKAEKNLVLKNIFN